MPAVKAQALRLRVVTPVFFQFEKFKLIAAHRARAGRVAADFRAVERGEVLLGLLGRLTEVWSGKPLDVFLRESVLEPLEMADTGFSVPTGKRAPFANCLAVRDGKFAVLDPAASSPFNDGFEFLSGGGGLLSTVTDYAKFCQMLVDGEQFSADACSSRRR